MESFDRDIVMITSDWEKGLYTGVETVGRLLGLAASYELDRIVDATPERLRQKLVERLMEIATAEGPYFQISGGIYAFETEPDPVVRKRMWDEHQARVREDAKEFESVIIPAVKKWARKRS